MESNSHDSPYDKRWALGSDDRTRAQIRLVIIIDLYKYVFHR